MSPEPFDSRAKALPAKRWEKGYGDENGEASIRIFSFSLSDACDRFGILNPWFWLVNKARFSGPDFTIRTPTTDRSEISNFGNFSRFLLHHKTK